MTSVLTRWRSWWDAVHDELTDLVENISQRWIPTAIFVASALTLYAEMVLVRFHGTCFHAFAIFKNVSLLSCFLGLGIGYGLSGRKRIALASVLPLLAFQCLLFGVLSLTNLGGRRFNPVGEQLVMGTVGDKWSWLHAVEGNAFLALVFVLNAVMFIPLGQLAGRLMGRLPKVQSYSLNVLGSLTGIGLFFVLSLAWTGPAVWIGVAALLLAPFLLGGRRTAVISTVSMSVIVLALGLMESRREHVFYSPYQVIAYRLPNTVDPIPTPTVRVNHCFYQDIFDCSPKAVAAGPRNAEAAQYYNLPYRLWKNPGDVCVVGAGTGNDVAAALRAGAKSVAAVEIDPAILYLGKHLHPERVYQDKRVTPQVNDARTFLRQTDKRFDTIIYGLLDSHTNLGAMTNVRLDSFVYTVEGFRDAIHRLTPNGLLIVSYLVLDQSQSDKLFAQLQLAYPDKRPRAFHNPTYGGTTFAAGPGIDGVPANLDGVTELTEQFVRSSAGTEVATDDWPFFYMKARTYPVSYLVMIGVLLTLSTVLVKRHLGLPKLASANAGTFFFLGAGFMLIETKAITELGLVFGNTWWVIAVAIGGILGMVYLANRWILWRGPVTGGLAFVLLGAALLLGLAVTRASSAGVSIPLPQLVMPLVLTLPLFFAGLIFSSLISGRGDLGEALSANLFGAMLGGFLEYNSMYWGYGSLYPLGIALYALAYICHVRARKQQAATETPAEASQPQARAA